MKFTNKLYANSLLTICYLLFVIPLQSIGQNTTGDPTIIKVDLSNSIGPFTPIWTWFGYDEPRSLLDL